MSTVTAASSRSVVGSDGAFTGTWTLARFVLRRDRVRIPVWLLGVTGFVVGSAASFQQTYPTEEARRAAASTMDLPAMVAMLGPNYAGPDDYTYGAMVSNQMLVMTALVVALMSVLLLVRHTRTEEQTGRAELVRATVVGRHAQTAAAVTVVAATDIVLAVLVAAALAGSGIETVDWDGSLLFGLALGAVGWVFTGVAVVAVQVTEHPRAASGMALAVLGLAYALRAVGDLGPEALAWLSPLGWAQETRAYIDDRWWPLLVAVAVTAVLVGIGIALSTRRDVGAGLRPPQPGSPEGSAALGTPLGHALRLQRAGLIGWAIALFLLGATYGSVLGVADDLLSEVEGIGEILPDVAGTDLTESFIGVILTVIAMIAAIHSVQAVLRLSSEETSGRAEMVLATAVSRPRWAAGHLAVALGGAALMLTVAALGLGLAGAGSTGDSGMILRTLGAALVHLPALWVTAGVAMALVGLVPRATTLAWVVIGYSFFVVYLGGFLGLPDWLANLSPFGHVPQLPAAELRLAPLVALTVVATALLVAGLAGLRRRDVRTPA